MHILDQLQDFVYPLVWSGSIAMFAIGVCLFVIYRIERKAGRDVYRPKSHRKGVSYHKPTVVPVEVVQHPVEQVAYLHAHARRVSLSLPPITQKLPRIEVAQNAPDSR